VCVCVKERENQTRERFDRDWRQKKRDVLDEKERERERVYG